LCLKNEKDNTTCIFGEAGRYILILSVFIKSMDRKRIYCRKGRWEKVTSSFVAMLGTQFKQELENSNDKLAALKEASNQATTKEKSAGVIAKIIAVNNEGSQELIEPTAITYFQMSSHLIVRNRNSLVLKINYDFSRNNFFLASVES